MRTVEYTVITIVLLILIPILGYGSWWLDRHVNWYFDYGPKVEKRLQKVNNRLNILEQRMEEYEATSN